MLPVMSSAPNGRLRARSAYSLRGLSPGETRGHINVSLDERCAVTDKPLISLIYSIYVHLQAAEKAS